MTTSVATLQSELYSFLGGRSDSTIQVASLRGLNLAQLLVAATYEPSELQLNLALSASSSTRTLAHSLITDLMTVRWVWNNTSDRLVDLFDSAPRMFKVVPPSGAYITALCSDAALLHVRPIPTLTNSLQVHYNAYPAVLLDGSSLAFSRYDDLILLIATAYCWLVLEEGEASATLDKLIDRISPTMLLTTESGKRLVRMKEVASGINV